MSEIGHQLINLVRQKAAENPSRVYERPRGGGGIPRPCQYIQGGEPGCIIGHALWDADLVNADFERADNNISPVYAVVDVLGLPLDPAEVDWLTKAQTRQDLQYPWGEAVQFADRLVTL